MARDYNLEVRCRRCDCVSPVYTAPTYTEAVRAATTAGWFMPRGQRTRAVCASCRAGKPSISPELVARREQIDAVYAPLRERREAERRELEEAVFAQARRPLPPHLARLVGDDGRVRVGARRSLVSEGVRP